MGLPDVRLVHRGHQRINLTIDQVPVHRRDESPAGADDGGGIGGRGEEEHKNNYNFKAASDNDNDEQGIFHPGRSVVISPNSTFSCEGTWDRQNPEVR